MYVKALTAFFAFALLSACAQESPGEGAADAGAVAETATGQNAAEMLDPAARVAAADPDKGKRLYILCQSCHSLNEGGINKVGPNLYNIVGQPAAQVEGFMYSAALNDAGLIWDAPTLDAWLERPSQLVPGTTMVFAGMSDPQQRAELIAYMQQVAAAQ